ncbi:MAG: hypothetical protein ACI94Y_004587 [Maribacter sp.]|jgi:hypothetical protein
MNKYPKYNFNLPPEEEVIKRNRTITTYYAQLYQNEPQLYKWAGMAAFASFHIGEKLQMWDWKGSGIKSLSFTCRKKNRTLEDDFQVIRIINNRIFTEIGGIHLTFGQMDFPSFKSLLLEQGRHQIILSAFEKLNHAREQLKKEGYSAAINEMVWEANTEILWHEQSEVVQPLFDKLSDLFSRAMTFFASFDYKINHHQTSWITRSRFILFMLFNAFSLLKKDGLIPEVTNLEHRWYWISNDILKKWKIVESDGNLITSEIDLLAQMEYRNLKM